MIPNTRNCRISNHEQFPCSHICTHKDCNLVYKWVCIECIKNNTHLHGQNTQSHLLGQEDFKSYFKQIDFKQLSEQEDKINQCVRALHKIRELINELDCYLQLCLKDSSSKILRDLQYIIDHQFFQINNEQISQIVKLKHNPNLTLDQNKIDGSVNQIIMLSQQLLQEVARQEQMVYQNQLYAPPQQNQKIKIISEQPKQLNQQDQLVKLVQQDQQVLQVQQVQQKVLHVQKQQVNQQPLFIQAYKKLQNKLTYEVFKEFQEIFINAAQISQNEKYLAYGGSNQKIIIYSLQSQITKEMKFDSIITACCFSRDSNLLYVGCQNGYFHCIQFETNLSQIYKEQLHEYDIWDIYQLENYQVMSGSDKNITISDIKEQKILYELDAPQGLDFKALAIKNFNIIVTGLSNRSINFYNQKLILLFRVNDVAQDNIDQIRFLGENQMIILDYYVALQLWEIDLNKQTSKKIREIKDTNGIYNVGVSQTRNQIITICQQDFVIFDKDFSNPQHFDLAQGDDVIVDLLYIRKQVMQLESMNYIIILGNNGNKIMKRTEQK